MNIEIKKLSPELTDDYIDFFEKTAFTDNKEWAGCYCVWYHWNDELEAEYKRYAAAGGKNFNRSLATKFIRDGILQGYLAYADGSVAGWCNANDKTGYDSLTREKCPELWEDTNDADKVKSIVCYTIAPAMRRKGIASELLQRVCRDAAAEGYTCVEAYPGKSKTNVVRNYHGPYPLYEKNGFTLYKELEGDYLVRKYL
jgi:GNAT superfamily N-acetyltransferase